MKGISTHGRDHRMILRRDDPAVPALKQLGEPLYLTETNPTAENLAQYIARRIWKYFKLDAYWIQVCVQEGASAGAYVHWPQVEREKPACCG